MEFFIVSVAALAVTAYLIYIIANNIFNIKLQIKPLLLCACCSLLISAILPRVVVGIAGITGAIATLVICAVLFSYVIAYHSDADEAAGTSSNLAAFTTEPEYNANSIKPEQFLSVIKKVSQTKQTAVNKKRALPDNSEQEMDQQESPILQYNSDEIEAATWMGILPEQQAPRIRTICQEKSGPNQPIETELETDSVLALQPLEIIQSKPRRPAIQLKNEPEAEAQLKVGNAPPESELLLTAINSLESLDDLLDYAFTQLNDLQPSKALAAFKRALSLSKESAVAPLILVEIGNILKNLGQYEEAVQLFSEGKNLPYLLNNSALNQQFIEMIAFLRIIKNNLQESRVGFVPYDKIPSDLMHKINEEFNDWLRLSCAKPQTGRIIEE